MTSAISNTTSTPAAKASGAPGANSAEDIQNQFISMLLAQVKAQDPLNPMDNAQMTSQMAQMSTVSGIEKLNATISSMSSSLLANQISQASALLGKTVVADGNAFSTTSGSAPIGWEVPEDVAKEADKLTVEVIDSNGKAVYTKSTNKVEAGVFGDTVSNLPNGKYSLVIKAYNADGDQIGGTIGFVRTNVVALTPSPDGASYDINLANGSSVSLSQIRQVQAA